MNKILLTTLACTMLLAQPVFAEEKPEQEQSRDDMNLSLEHLTEEAKEIVRQITETYGEESFPKEKARQFIFDFAGAHFEREFSDEI